MANFKLVVSDPKSRKAYQKEVEQGASGLVGKKIGETVKADFMGLAGYEIKLTGGSDKNGFPMRADVEGPGVKKVVLSGGTGFHPTMPGQSRERQSPRTGDTSSPSGTETVERMIRNYLGNWKDRPRILRRMEKIKARRTV